MRLTRRCAWCVAIGLCLCAAAPLFAGFPARSPKPQAKSAGLAVMPGVEEKEAYTDEEDYLFLVDLARVFPNPDVSDKIFIVAQKAKRSSSYPASIRRLKTAERDFLISLADKLTTPRLADRLRKIAEKIPG